MGMKQTLDVINRMEADGIIGRYAIAGPVAAYNYVETALTDDLDILIAFEASAQGGIAKRIPPPAWAGVGAICFAIAPSDPVSAEMFKTHFCDMLFR